MERQFPKFDQKGASLYQRNQVSSSIILHSHQNFGTRLWKQTRSTKSWDNQGNSFLSVSGHWLPITTTKRGTIFIFSFVSHFSSIGIHKKGRAPLPLGNFKNGELPHLERKARAVQSSKQAGEIDVAWQTHRDTETSTGFFCFCF